jgi:hypothetical protein
MTDYAHQMPLLASLEGGRNTYAAVSESEVICDLRCGLKAKVTHLWASTLAGAAETSPCAISRYFVWRREDPERLDARPRGALFQWVSIWSLEA